MTPEVSIVIPTFNRVGSLKNTLDSVSSQTLGDWECLVVDDGSNDGTDALVLDYTQKDPRFKYFKRPADRIKGANACRNIGISNSVGKYITFLDSDDVYLPEHIGERIKHLHQHNAVAAYGAGWRFDGTKDVLVECTLKTREMTWFDYLLKDTVLICALFIKREIVQRTMFDETLFRHQDWDFIMRLPQEIDFVYFPEPTFRIFWIRYEKRTVDFQSCITVYERYKGQLTKNYYLRRYLLNLYEKAVIHNTDKKYLEFYRREVKKQFSDFSMVEKFKLNFPGMYRTLRSVVIKLKIKVSNEKSVESY